MVGLATGGSSCVGPDARGGSASSRGFRWPSSRCPRGVPLDARPCARKAGVGAPRDGVGVDPIGQLRLPPRGRTTISYRVRIRTSFTSGTVVDGVQRCHVWNLLTSLRRARARVSRWSYDGVGNRTKALIGTLPMYGYRPCERPSIASPTRKDQQMLSL